MSEFVRCLVGMFAVIAPFGALTVLLANVTSFGATKNARLWAGAPAAAFAVLALFALISDPLLDLIDVSPESFQFAAGAAMFPLALRLILTGDAMAMPETLPRYAWLLPLAVPTLAGPSSIIAAVSYGARFGEAEAIVAAGATLTITACLFATTDHLQRLPLIVWQTIGRLSGGLLLAIAVELAVDGVRSV